jgi:rubredoxin
MTKFNIERYTEREGDESHEWKAGTVTEQELEFAWQNKPKDSNTLWLKRQRVHALFLADGRIWDCVNKYRTRGWLRDSDPEVCNWCMHRVSYERDNCSNCGAPYDAEQARCDACDAIANFDNKRKQWHCTKCSATYSVETMRQHIHK